MADQPTSPEESHWLVEPSPGEAHIHVAVGEGAEITSELRSALESLVGALQQEEVVGYARKCEERQNCSPLGTCHPQLASPCATFSTCRIKG
jgi:hypothetical protein